MIVLRTDGLRCPTFVRHIRRVRIVNPLGLLHLVAVGAGECYQVARAENADIQA